MVTFFFKQDEIPEDFLSIQKKSIFEFFRLKKSKNFSQLGAGNNLIFCHGSISYELLNHNLFDENVHNYGKEGRQYLRTPMGPAMIQMEGCFGNGIETKMVRHRRPIILGEGLGFQFPFLIPCRINQSTNIGIQMLNPSNQNKMKKVFYENRQD